ncbi:competence type IV pilus minor pilin ComGD [Planococcus shenhongbingii]|uniref:Competence type IV pilus minor pilin ComGD n=1 Tax=Planococcus shenhongbingii TaxID=3058398 RepID=A0ABT8NDB6_9BACL|nr:MULTISPECIES: competence type IV pilus minor pilin ComGD [unclassified Planococcus (in: firmicutes)]MDN7245753.1 competence type IV pilus minor pilin ComGD [Planococcus sp. N017]WKA60448.1 competence type IV pilus minor pilin ComGD [Planococcus sp. N016]
MKSLLKETGFTLIEMLLVLAVLMTVVGIAIPSYRTFEIDKEEDRFFDLLLRDIYFAQSESYRTKAPVMVVFREADHTYEVIWNLKKGLPPRKIPLSVKVKKTSNINGVYFTANGSVSSSGTIYFSTSTGDKSMVVHLGKGRVVFSE